MQLHLQKEQRGQTLPWKKLASPPDDTIMGHTLQSFTSSCYKV